jgi:hypothetical protein
MKTDSKLKDFDDEIWILTLICNRENFKIPESLF